MEKKQRALTEAKNEKPIRLAAIDIGSNAARLLIAEVVENGKKSLIDGFRSSKSVSKPISSYHNSDVALCTIS